MTARSDAPLEPGVQDALAHAMEALVAEAMALPEVPAIAREAYEAASGTMVARVDAAVLKRPESSSLLGTLPPQRLRDNHRHHAAFGVVLVPDRIRCAVLTDHISTEVIDGVCGLVQDVDGSIWRPYWS